VLPSKHPQATEKVIQPTQDDNEEDIWNKRDDGDAPSTTQTEMHWYPAGMTVGGSSFWQPSSRTEQEVGLAVTVAAAAVSVGAAVVNFFSPVESAF
jgi:hypothetical protein